LKSPFVFLRLFDASLPRIFRQFESTAQGWIKDCARTGQAPITAAPAAVWKPPVHHDPTIVTPQASRHPQRPVFPALPPLP
jgi:hypothetical protein